MSRVHSKDTQAEVRVRSVLHRLGYRFRIHRSDLPGKPDIVLPKHNLAIFVHGCFWHRHERCPRATTPSSNRDYWLPKFERTVVRDRKNRSALRRQGWRVAVVWECELKNAEKLIRRLQRLLG